MFRLLLLSMTSYYHACKIRFFRGLGQRDFWKGFASQVFNNGDAQEMQNGMFIVGSNVIRTDV